MESSEHKESSSESKGLSESEGEVREGEVREGEVGEGEVGESGQQNIQFLLHCQMDRRY